MLESDVSFRVLDLNLLRVLDAMVTEGSVAGAAARLSITPSAVSHALGRLRALFKDPLFIRAPGGMRATPRALEVGGKVREGLRYLEGALTPTAFVAAESRRTFSIACSAYVSAVLLPDVIARLREQAPAAQLAVLAWSPDVVERFAAGQVDILVGDFLRIPAGCEVRLLFEDRLAWLMGRDYILAGAPDAARTRIAAARARLPSRSVLDGGFERRTALDEGCCIVANPVGGAPEAPLLESLPYALIAPLVVKQADFAALLPRRLAAVFARDLRLDIVEPAANAIAEEIRISAVCHPEYGRRAPVVWFRDLLIEAAATAKGTRPDGSAAKKKVAGEKPHALPR